MRRLSLALFMLLVSATAGAQIGRSRYQISAPSVWVSAGAKLQQSFGVTDGSTKSQWNFGSATTYGGALEKALGNGMTLGVSGATGLVPLRYDGAGASYDADARVSQLFGTFRVSSGQGFHTVLELSAGATIYSDFRTRTASVQLAPVKADEDFAFSFGYGFGYSFSPRMSVDVVQDVTTSVHQKAGLSASDDASTRIGGTRIMARFGLGGR